MSIAEKNKYWLYGIVGISIYCWHYSSKYTNGRSGTMEDLFSTDRVNMWFY